MVVLRALQGFAGGVLIPLALTCVIIFLPPRARPTGFAMFALTATFAPAIGPDHRWPTSPTSSTGATSSS